jgi:hypothetical protein
MPAVRASSATDDAIGSGRAGERRAKVPMALPPLWGAAATGSCPAPMRPDLLYRRALDIPVSSSRGTNYADGINARVDLFRQADGPHLAACHLRPSFVGTGTVEHQQMPARRRCGIHFDRAVSLHDRFSRRGQ